jgi:predicted Zn-dependent protease
VLRPWVDAGAAYDEPYAWVAQLFLRQKDTAGAIENISAGIGRVPASVRLRVLRGEIAYSQGRFSEAQAWADSTRLYLRSREDSLLWYDLLLRLKPAPSMIEEVANRFPTYMAGQTAWIRHLLATGRKEEAYQRSSRLLDIDPYDPELWAVYGEAAAAMGLSEEADFARKKPDPCPSAL